LKAEVKSEDVRTDESSRALTVKTLIKRKADIAKVTDAGNTALHLAALSGDVEAVKILVDAGAKVKVENLFRWRPLHLAAYHNHPKALVTLAISENKTDHDFVLLLTMMFRLMSLAQEKPKVLSIMKQLLPVYRTDHLFHLALAKAFLREDYFDVASKTFDAAIDLNPANCEVSELEDVSHDGARCDGEGCNKTITGYKYTCSVCADIDFCHSCASVPQDSHPAEHKLLRAPSEKWVLTRGL
jgi:hypothetical protein